ncbi:MAG: MarR family transcriptional regulator [Gammaproteobacteria bacterium]|nr:MAG: MarR family transcriptional regulator [Gammaproteobacteria bacterium]
MPQTKDTKIAPLSGYINQETGIKNGHHWTFLTNHAHVLLCLANNNSLRMRDIANIIGITERTVQQIVRDLSKDGYVKLTREGRCNRYEIDDSVSLRHPIEQHKTIGDLIRLIFE